MPIYKIRATRMMAEEAEVYVYADNQEEARAKTYEDINDIVDSYADWEVDSVLSDDTDIEDVTEVTELPKDYEIPEELDFRTPVAPEDIPAPVDPRQLKLPV